MPKSFFNTNEKREKRESDELDMLYLVVSGVNKILYDMNWTPQEQEELLNLVEKIQHNMIQSNSSLSVIMTALVILLNETLSQMSEPNKKLN